MKKILIFLWTAVAIALCFHLSSCSNDDDEPTNSLLGTWYLENNDDDFDEGELFNGITFKENNVVVRPADDEDPDSYTDRYYVTGNKLRIDFNIEDGVVDDFTYGTFSISGNKLTYTFHWYSNPDEIPGESEDENDLPSTITLIRK